MLIKPGTLCAFEFAIVLLSAACFVLPPPVPQVSAHSAVFNIPWLHISGGYDSYAVFKSLHFTYLEINPIVMVGAEVYILDLAAKLDQTAE